MSNAARRARTIAAAALTTACFAAACTPAPELGARPCPSRQVYTAAGCLPVPDRTFPTRDAGAGQDPARDASSRPDIGMARDTGPTNAPDAAGSDPIDAGPLDSGEEGVALTGTWALRVIGVDTVTSESLGATASATMTTISKVEVTQMGTSLVLTTEVCAVEPGEFEGYTTRYPQQTIAAIPVTESDATIDVNAVGARFVPAQRVQLLGWRALGNRATERLPEQAGDLRLQDMDNDGNPGVTVEINGPIDGDMYIATRLVLDLDGTVVSGDRIEGLSRATREQRTVGASNDLLAESVLTYERDPDPSRSTFELVRLSERTDPTCAGVLGARGSLFGP